jgi:hypothetical protein
MNNDLINISLKQGKQFNVYQTKIKQDITEGTFKQNKNNMEGFVSLEQEQIVRPSSDGYSPVLKNIQATTTSNNVSNQKDLDDLKELQTRYNQLIQEYNNIREDISTASKEAINRVSSNNPYLGKNLQFTDGTIVYVTNQGIAKLYTSEEIFKNMIGKNGCPTEIIKLNIPWTSEYIQDSKIPTNPSLIVGSNMIMGQSCGNEGKNVYASKLVNDPNSEYIGCYNDKPPLTNINIVPIMNSSNKNNGFVSSASSVDGKFGAWFAFDKNPNTFWHSQVGHPSRRYNTKTGFYEGTNGISIVNIGKVSGEFLQINMPGVNTPQAQNVTVTQYSIEPRLDACCLTTRSPNSWYVLGYKDTQWYQVDRQKNQSFTSGISKVYNVAYPGAYSAYMMLVDRVGNNDINRNRHCVQVAGWNLFANSDLSDNKGAMILNSDITGYTSFDKCQEYALDNGFNFFGLQDVQQNGTAKCLVSNDIERTKMYGDANIQSISIPACEVINNRTYGRKMINAVYELDSIGNKSTLGNIGYIDSDTILRKYPDSMVGFTNDYQIYQNTDSIGNDITTLVTSDQNDCQIACNNNPDCSAYVYQSSSQTCRLKNRSAFPKGNKQPNNNVLLGVRNPGLKGSSSCSNKISNIDTVQFDNYMAGDKMTPDTRCIPSIISQEDQIRYDNVMSQLIIIGNDIVAKMENLYNLDNKIKIFEKLNTNAEQFQKDLENYKLTNLKIKNNLNISQNLNSDNIEEGMRNLTNSSNLNDLSGMLSDSDLRVLTENYSYIMWSILAVGILTITINTMKNRN